MTALSKRNDPARRWKSFWRHLTISCQPFVFSTAAVLIWQATNQAGLHFSRQDEASLTCAIIPGVFIAWSIIAGWFFTTIYGKYRTIVGSVLQSDEKTFMLYRDERMPIVLHLFLGSLSFLLFSLVALLDFKEFLAGAISIFVLSYCLVFYWVVMVQLDDPTLSPWLQERTPGKWLTQSVDEYFGLTEQLHETQEASKATPHPVSELVRGR